MTLHDFMELEIAEIKRYKWIQSQKAGYDLGDGAVFDWVERYAAEFRARVLAEHREPIEYPNGKAAPTMAPHATNHCSFGCQRIS